MSDAPRRRTGEPVPAPRRPTIAPRERPALAVLFVDPDGASAQRLARALRGAGPIGIVSTAQAAQEAIRVRLPDLLVTEIALPDMNGIEFIGRLHAAPATHHMLLLVVTHRASITEKIAAFQAGADDYLVKPVAPDEFVMHVQVIARFRQVLG